MKNRIYAIILAFLPLLAFSQSVPFPSSQGRDYNAIEAYGYEQNGTSWNTAAYLPFIYHGIWFRMLLPAGVTWNGATKSFSNANPSQKYPAMLFFHGRGEVGDDNNRQLINGGELHKNAALNGTYPGFLIYPQSIGYEGGEDLMEKLISQLPIDINKIYVHGLSNGGQETWKFLIANPTLVAAAFPMSAADLGARTENLLYTPLRESQGELDTNPAPNFSQQVKAWFDDNGGHLEYFLLPNTGHGTWNQMYTRADYFPWFLSHAKNEITVRYDRNLICPNSDVSVVLGFTPGLQGYEWYKDGVLIPGATAYKITVTSFGAYTARIRNRGTWYNSTNTVTVGSRPASVTPNIILAGQSLYIPDVNGSSAVTLAMPEGYATYKWFRQGQTDPISTSRTVTVSTPGNYSAVITENGGCPEIPSIPSPVVTIKDATAGTAPDPAANLLAYGASLNSIQLTWENNTSPSVNETGFEIYRSSTSGGPYSLVATTGADVLSYLDAGLVQSQLYYYKVRAISANGASAATAEVQAITQVDTTPPSPPVNVSRTLLPNSTNPTGIRVNWSASTDNIGVAGYVVYLREYPNSNWQEALAVGPTATSGTILNLPAGKYYNLMVKARDAAGNYSDQSIETYYGPLFPSGGTNGINYKRYAGSWTVLPNFPALTPNSTGNQTTITLSNLPNPADNFGFMYEGHLAIGTAGDYTFSLLSDEGSNLYIDNVLVVANDGVHTATVTKTGTVNLAVGYHAIRMDYFDRTGTQSHVLRWKNDALGIDQTIPTNVLYRNYNPANNYTPAPLPAIVPTAFAFTGTTYNSITLGWAPYKGTGTKIEVYSSPNGSTWTLRQTLDAATATSWTHTGLTPSTRYYYRLRAVNFYTPASSSTFTSSINTTTTALPAVPSAPTNLTVTNITATTANVNWSDNATNEDAYEVYKSSPDNAHYAKSATLPANSVTTLDNTLFPHTTYFFKVQGKNVSGISAASNEVQITTPNRFPVLANIADVTMRHSASLSIPISATDADGDLIILGSNNLPAFAQIFDFGDGTGQLFLNPTAADTIPGLYNNLVVFAEDLFGGRVTKTFSIRVNNNHTPVVSDPGAITLKESYKQTVVVTGTDADTEALTWTFNNVPSFVSPVVTANSVSLSIQPGVNDAGVYSFDLTATDPNGAAATRNVSVTVSEFNPNYKVFVNVRDNPGGANPTTNPTWAAAPWNNYSYGLATLALNTEAGFASGASFVLGTTGWTSGTAGVTPGIYPNAVNSSYVYFQANTPTDSRTVKFTGLNPSGKYRINILGSRTNPNDGNTRTSIYTIGAQTQQLNASNNANTTANFDAITPNAAGEINIVVTAVNGAGADYAYINGVVLESYLDALTPPVAPSTLAANIVNSTIRLTWVDASSDEGNFEVYRSIDNTNFTKIATLISNATSYNDPAAISGTTYYYQVVATNSIGASPASNVVTIVGPNHAPVIATVAPIQIGEDDMKYVVISATDADGDGLVWDMVNAPGFAWLEYIDEHSTSLVLSPTVGDAGDYNFQVTSNDGHGALTTANVSVTVGTPGEVFYSINFTTATSLAPAPWNNFSVAPSAGAALNNLKNNSNVASTISMTNQSNWTTTNTEGYNSGNNSGIYPDNVTRTSIYYDGTAARNLLFTGLDPAKTYDFTFFASRLGVTEVRNATYTIGFASATLNATGNTSNVVKVVRAKANASGQLTVSVAKTAGTYAYLGSIVIREYTAPVLPVPPTAPQNVKLLSKSRTSMRLAWTDTSPNETGFEIYRSTTSNGTYSLVATVAANTTSYINTGLTTGTTYYYKMRSLNTDGPSDFTPEASATTYLYAIQLNFDGATSGDRNAPSDWIEVTAQPAAGAVQNSLVDDTGVNTGVSMTQVAEFAGQNHEGKIAGSNSGVVPDGVLRGMWWMDKGQTAVLKFSNMSFLRKYNFIFVASRDADGNRTTNYTIGTTTVSLDAALNTQNYAQISNVSPASDGTVTVTIYAPLTSLFGYLNGIMIQAVPNAGGRMAADETADVAFSETIDAAHSVQASPNPFSDRIVLKVGMAGSFNVRMFTVTGVVAFQNQFDGDEGQEVEIPLDGGLAAGIYMLNVTDSSGATQTIRLLKK